ncbi:MAG: hypothetical protein LH470_09855 [Lysobacter sp.]|nr:hypothetical protein [Lysobacter sp.]
MPTFRILLAAAMLVLAGAVFAEIRIIPQDSGVKVRLRGISAVSTNVAWASGREGTVLRTIDGGKVWQAIKVPGAGELDFRDVEGFDADTAVVLSIGPGEASRVYRTEDAGKTWKLSLQNQDPRAFFDCMAFEGTNGWMLGDPVDGRFQIYASSDAGKNWRLQGSGPGAAQGEAAFAASGTCIAITGSGLIAVTGGSMARAHIKVSVDKVWSATSAAGLPSAESKGYFSVAVSASNVLLVGGDYKTETAPGIFAVVTEDGAHSLKQRLIEGAESREDIQIRTPVKQLVINSAEPITLRETPSPRGYRSGIACAQQPLPCVAVGPSGVDSWSENAWQPVSDVGYDAIDFAGNVGWLSGDAGRIARIEISE